MSGIEPKGVRFDATINLGHILTFIGFMATGAGAYMTLDKRVAVLETQSAYQKERDLQQDIYLKEQVAEIRKLLERIEAKLETRLERK